MSVLRKVLTGHSGCNVLLMQDDEEIFVRKSSGKEKYNFRLKKQCKKQSNFVSTQKVLAPAVTSAGYEDGLFYFDMEFVQGKTLAEYTSSILITEISDFIRLLFKSLYIESSVVNVKANMIFGNKISTLENELSDVKTLEPIFEILKNHDWSNIYKSPCHGDLTLENIIITKDKKLYLIDFLDSFYNSWMVDIAKLLQDLELKWSFRHTELSQNRELRLLVAKDALIEEILKTENGEQNLNNIYHILLLNIVRIYPYATDSKTLAFLDNAVNTIKNKLDVNLVGGKKL